MRRVAVEACPVCGDERRATLHRELRDRTHGTPGTTDLARCLECGSVYQDPIVVPDDLPLLYPESYYTHHEPGVGVPRPGGGMRDRLRAVLQDTVRGARTPLWARVLARFRRVRERAFFDLPDEVVPRSRDPGRALEIGPGTGWELALLARAGWEAEGVEWDAEAAEVASAFSGRTVHTGDYQDAPLDHGRYELIYLNHVLEHLPDPGSAIRFLGDRLSASGKAVVIVPNPESVASRLLGSRWLHWDPPRHLVLPSAEGLVRLSKAAGLRVSLTDRTRGPVRRAPGGEPAPLPVRAWTRVRSWLPTNDPRRPGEELVAVFRRAANGKGG